MKQRATKGEGFTLYLAELNDVTITDAQAATMRKVVAANAHDADDEALLLDVLGIGGVA